MSPDTADTDEILAVCPDTVEAEVSDEAGVPLLPDVPGLSEVPVVPGDSDADDTDPLTTGTCRYVSIYCTQISNNYCFYYSIYVLKCYYLR